MRALQATRLALGTILLVAGLTAVDVIRQDHITGDVAEAAAFPVATGGAVGPLFLQPPRRVFDSRLAYGGRGQLHAGTRLTLGIGQGGPHGAMLNLTCTESESDAYIVVWDGSGPQPATSNVNCHPGQNVANQALTLVRGNGAFDVYTNGTTDLIIDVVAWYWIPPPEVAP